MVYTAEVLEPMFSDSRHGSVRRCDVMLNIHPKCGHIQIPVDMSIHGAMKASSWATGEINRDALVILKRHTEEIERELDEMFVRIVGGLDKRWNSAMRK